MNDNKTILLYGLFLLNSIHWGGVVLTALLNNVIGRFVEFDELPWFRLVIVSAQVIVAFKLLDRMAETFLITTRSLKRIMTSAVSLFILAQFDAYYDYSQGFCGTALLDGSLDHLFAARERNLSYVQGIETITLSLAMVSYTLLHVKKIGTAR